MALPLPGLMAANKRQVTLLLSLAYQTTVMSFDEALEIVRAMGLCLIYVEIVKGKIKYTYPAERGSS